jgi:endo-1,4-beta-xylanase
MTPKNKLFLLCCFSISLLFSVQLSAQTTAASFDFESGNLNGWRVLNAGSGVNITQEDKRSGSFAVKLESTASSQNYWDIQLETPAIATIPSHQYRISFWARAVGGGGIIRLSTSTSGQLRAAIGGDDRQYLHDLNIGNEWQLHTYESVYGSNLLASASELILRIDAGKVPNKVYYIDDFKVEDLTPDYGTDVGTTPMAKNHSKFLGNIVANNVPATFDLYWNQITPENSGKWGSVEGQRNVMNWAAHDRAYNHAKSKGYKFKYHTLVWGSQEPQWISSLAPADQKRELEEFMQAVANRYPDMEYIDVVNEALHAPSSMKDAIGGDGATGWDWVIWSFRKARELFPNSKLHINDYGIISDPPKARRYVEIINLLKNENLIDGIGIQCHEFNMNTVTVNTMRNVLNILAATGLPIHVSELDITGAPNISEESQYQIYKTKFPVLWEHEAVIGVTLWGYITGSTWVAGTGIVEANGAERKAMVWLKNYMASEASKVPNKFYDATNLENTTIAPTDMLQVFPNPTTGVLNIRGNEVKEVEIYNIAGSRVMTGFNPGIMDVSHLENGLYMVRIKSADQYNIQRFVKQ